MVHLNYLHRDPNLIRLLSVFVFDHCVDSYYLLGVCRMGCPDLCTTILLRARATTRFSLDGWRWPVDEPTTAIDLLPLLLRLWSIRLSRCGLAPKHPPPSLPHIRFKMPLEYFHPHSILPTATLVRKPARSCAACVRGENDDGNSDVRGSADVKHSWHHHSAWVSTHSTLLTHGFLQERSPLCLPWFTHSHPMTHWTRWWCVSLRSFCNAQPPFHGLRIPLDTHHVQMSFFHAMSCRSNPFPTHSAPHPKHLFSPSCFLNMSVGEALLRWASSMMFNTDASKVRMRSPREWPKRSAVGTTTFHGIADFNPLFYQMKNRCCTNFIQTLKPAVSTFYNMVKSDVQHIANRMFTYYSIICHPSVFFTP